MRYLIRYYQPHLFPDNNNNNNNNNNNAKITAEQSSAKNKGISEPGASQVDGGSPVVSVSSDAAVEGLRRQLQGVIEFHQQWLVEGTDEKSSSSSSSSLVAVVAGYLSFLQVLYTTHDPLSSLMITHLFTHSLTHSLIQLASYLSYLSIYRPLSCTAADNGLRCVQLLSSFSLIVVPSHHHGGGRTCSDGHICCVLLVHDSSLLGSQCWY